MNELLQNEVLLVFGEDFDRHPHALEHLLRPLFGLNHIIWVETIGLRSPKFNLYDIKRIFEKIKSWRSSKNKRYPKKSLPQHFQLISPLMLPFNQFSLVRKFNTHMVKKAVKTALLNAPTKPPILITSVPNAGDYVGLFKEKFKLYFCVDEFSLWPGLDLNLVKTLEDNLLQKVDRVIATSESLSLSKNISGFDTPIISHGVDFSHFHLGPIIRNSQSKANIGSFGLIDERLDQDLVCFLAQALPHIVFHFIGPYVCNIERMKSMPNLIFYGRREYSELPKLIANMDMFLLPYKKNELTRNINPLKLKEYLATGRPVLASSIAEVVKLRQYLFTFDSKEQALDVLKKFDSGKLEFNSNIVTDYVKNNESWESKCLSLSRFIQASMSFD